MSFLLVLGCDRPLVGVDAENCKSSRRHPIDSFSCRPAETALPEFSQHQAFRQSCVFHARHGPREQDPPLLAQYRLDALAPRLHKGFKVGDRVVGASALSPSDAAGQEAVVGSARRVVVTRARST